MNFKRLIAFAVMLATLLSCCVFSTSVFADTEATPYNCATWDGLIYNKNGVLQTQNTYFSYLGNAWSSYPTLEMNRLSSDTLKASSSDDTDTHLFALAANGSGTGAIQSLSGDSERGNYYELTASVLRNNTYKNGNTNTQPTADRPVLLFSYYIKVPEASKTVTKNQIFRVTGNGSNSKYRAYITFTYAGSNQTMSVEVTQVSADKEWGVDTFDIDPDKWYKFEGRMYVRDDEKYGLGIYLNGTQVAYYIQSNTVDFVNVMKMYQIDLTGEDDSTSPGLTYYDDIHYGLYPASYKPSETDPNAVADEITLTATQASGTVTGTAVMTGNKVTDATLIVALFDSSYRFIKLVPSTTYTDDNGTRTMTYSLSGAESGNKYRVFLFDNLTSATPLAEMVEDTIE